MDVRTIPVPEYGLAEDVARDVTSFGIRLARRRTKVLFVCALFTFRLDVGRGLDGLFDS